MWTARTSSGKEFTVPEHEALLDAAEQAGVRLEYSCRTGRCSSCKAKVSAGETTALHDELGLTQAERAEGWILTCVRTALSDVELDVEDLGDVELLKPRTVPCRINEIELLAPDVAKVTVRVPPTQALDFLPGQHAEVIGPDGVRRSYSMSNAPREDKTLEFHVRRVDGGVLSDYWFEKAAAEDLLRLHGPLGTFFLRDAADTDVVFLATGTGIAPVKSMLEQLASSDVVPRSVAVYWGGRHPEDLYWTPPADWPESWRFVRVLSRADDAWAGERGYVQDALLRDGFTPDAVMVYACGSDDMIHSARTALVAQGLDPHRFFSDAFVSSTPA